MPPFLVKSPPHGGLIGKGAYGQLRVMGVSKGEKRKGERRESGCSAAYITDTSKIKK